MRIVRARRARRSRCRIRKWIQNSISLSKVVTISSDVQYHQQQKCAVNPCIKIYCNHAEHITTKNAQTKISKKVKKAILETLFIRCLLAKLTIQTTTKSSWSMISPTTFLIENWGTSIYLVTLSHVCVLFAKLSMGSSWPLPRATTSGHQPPPQFFILAESVKGQ
jgi:hypothetical protein